MNFIDTNTRSFKWWAGFIRVTIQKCKNAKKCELQFAYNEIKMKVAGKSKFSHDGIEFDRLKNTLIRFTRNSSVWCLHSNLKYQNLTDLCVENGKATIKCFLYALKHYDRCIIVTVNEWCILMDINGVYLSAGFECYIWKQV